MNATFLQLPLPIEQLIGFVEDIDLRRQLETLHNYSIEHWGFNTQPASVRHHHSWEGGYRSHIGEVVSIALKIFDDLHQRYASRGYSLNCSRDEVIVAAYIHDLYKLTRYRKVEVAQARGPDEDIYSSKPAFEFIKKPRIEDTALVVARCVEGAGFVPSEMILHAVTMHHGGWSDVQASVYSYGDRLESLAAILAAADMISGFVLGGQAPRAL